MGRHFAFLFAFALIAGSSTSAHALPPIISFTSPTSIGEGREFTVDVAVSDPDGDTPTWSWDANFDMTFGEMPGATSHTVAAGTTDGPRLLRIGVRATDGTETTTVYRSIRIDNVAPEITTHPLTTAGVRREYRYEIGVDDPAGALDPLEYTVVGPSTMEVTGNVLTWTPSIDQRGRSFDVTLTVSDGDTEVEQRWTIDVARNAPPTVATPVSPLLGENLPVDEPVTLTVNNATDPDGDPLTYFFRLSRNALFEPPGVIGSGGVPQAEGDTTSWTTPEPLDPGMWYWEVWVSDGIVDTQPRHAHALVGTGALPDGGIIGGVDAGMPDGGVAPPPPSDDSGCSATGSAGHGNLAWILGALLVLFVGRRRRLPLGAALLGALLLFTAGCKRGDPSSEVDAGTPILGEDDDGDTIHNDDEEARLGVDTDGDGEDDYLDLDADNDGLPDEVEAGDHDLATDPRDSDRDGAPDFRDTDSDDSGIPDVQDSRGDADSDGIADWADLDDDNDLVSDSLELADYLYPAADADNDGRANYQDPDSDDDYILDGDEYPVDTDADGLRDFEDQDSDNDGIPDAMEAGDQDVYSPPVDTDGDMIPDFRDTDSDNDGLSDAGELDLGTNPGVVDSDGDGVSDLIEIGAGTDPTDGTVSPRTRGDFVFVVPYEETPMPERDTLRFRTSLQLVDIYFLFDISGSMLGEIDGLRSAVTTLMGDLTCMDFGSHCVNDGDCGSAEACSIGGTCIENPSLSGCIASPWTGGGIYEADYQNLLSLQDDPSRTSTALSVATFGFEENLFGAVWSIADPASAPGAAAGCAPEMMGRVGCPAFRENAAKILVAFTDEENNGGSETVAQAATALRDADITFIGVWSGTAGSAARNDLIQLANMSGSLSGAGTPLFFEGMDAAVVPAVASAINEVVQGVPLRITIGKTDEPDDAGDSLQFIDYLEVNTTAATCTDVSLIEDTDDDGRPDAYPSLLPGTPVCWDVVPKQNDTVMPTLEPQVFRARLTVYGDGSPLDSRVVYFLVPPYIPPPDVPI